VRILLSILALLSVFHPALGHIPPNGNPLNLPASMNFQYDINGNLRTNGNRRFDYDEENRLIAVTQDTKRSEFWYDALGRRQVTEEFEWGNPADSLLVTNVVLSSTIRTGYTGWVGFKMTVGSRALRFRSWDAG
jgi:YD repeat-containing protein